MKTDGPPEKLSTMAGTTDTTGHEHLSLTTGRLPVIGIDEGVDIGNCVVGIDMVQYKQKGNSAGVERTNRKYYNALPRCQALIGI
jgi:hypothetical protein